MWLKDRKYFELQRKSSRKSWNDNCCFLNCYLVKVLGCLLSWLHLRHLHLTPLVPSLPSLRLSPALHWPLAVQLPRPPMAQPSSSSSSASYWPSSSLSGRPSFSLKAYACHGLLVRQKGRFVLVTVLALPLGGFVNSCLETLHSCKVKSFPPVQITSGSTGDQSTHSR